MTQTRTRTLRVPGAEIVHDVHGELTAGTVPLLLVGAPMDAGGFATLAAHLPDRVVVTVDTRNAGRGTREEPTAAVTAEQHAEDLHALVQALREETGGGPVDVFASSGGAVNALVLVARHPGDVRTLVAHEPPASGLLPDAAVVRAVCEDMVAAYDALGTGPAMARFITLVMQRGELPDGYLDRPEPDPSMFGLPLDDDGSRDDGLMSNLRGGLVSVVPDVEALRVAPTRVVLAVGEESGGPVDGELAARSTYAVAAALGQEAVLFPGGHAGFVGGEHGQVGRPVEFAARLREVLGQG